MSARAKKFGLLIVAQVACVALGLWIEQRHTRSSLREAAVTKAWADLAEAGLATCREMLGGEGMADELDVERQLGAESVETVRDLLARVPRIGRWGVTLVDGDRAVVDRREANPSGAALSPAIGEALVWTDVPVGLYEGSGATAGGFEAEGERQVAVSYAVGNGSGYLIFHRSRSDVAGEAEALGAGFGSVGVLAGVWTCSLLGITLYIMLASYTEREERALRESDAVSLKRIQSLVRTQDAVIFGLAKLADSRDPETGDHLERISVYSSMLASAMRRLPKYGKTVTPAFVRLIGTSSALHDIGKVGIEDSVLLKPGPLTDEERSRMEVHTTIGADCLREIERRLGNSNFLEMAREIALSHHERWDGSGYPEKLAGEAIPLSARIISVCDVYDALSSRRVYKSAIPHAKCVEIVREGAGKQFDPEIVEIWLTLADQFLDMARRYAPADDARDAGRVGGVDDASKRVATTVS